MHDSMCQNSHESSAKLMDASISHPMTGHLTGSLPAKLVEEQAQLLGRNNSSCSISSSDFEFDFSEQVLYDEPPLSPKLASFNAFFPYWETAITSTNDAASNRTQDYTTAAASTNNIADGLPQHMKEWETRNNASGANNNSDRTSNSVVINASDGDQLHSKKHARVPLRSLMLERRDLDQLPPLFNNPHLHPSNSCIVKDGCAGDGDVDHHHHQKPTSIQSPLSCSSPSHYSCSSSASSSSSSTSSPELLDSQTKKKKNRWSFNLDFLKKCSPGKAHADRLHQGQLQDLRVAENYHFNDGLHLPLGRASISADESMRALNEADRTLTGYNFSSYESPRRHSTCGSSSSTSILINSSAIPKRDDQREAMNIKAREGKLQRRAISAPVSPAASPSRVPAAATHYSHISASADPAASPTSTRSRPIISMPSPHAQHYQQQRARAEAARRKTFLPYRPSLLGARLFHFTPQPAQVC